MDPLQAIVTCTVFVGSWPSDFALSDHKACTAVASKAAARLEINRAIDRIKVNSNTIGSLLKA